MHSFHQSRGRIAFEVLCSLTVSGSCVGAWLQTGASALLPAAVAAGLYGLWHVMDMRRHVEAPAIVPAASKPVAEAEREPVPMTTVESAAAAVVDEPPKPKRRSRKKQADAAPAPAHAMETESEAATSFPDRAAIEEELHAPIAPLFEAKPFALQQRPTFGRKAG